MRRTYLASVVLILAIASCSKYETQPEISDLNKATSIAIAKVTETQKTQVAYKIISAKQIIIKGKYVWCITLKPAKLIPIDPSKQEIGAGGEIIVTVDLKTNEAIITHGE